MNFQLMEKVLDLENFIINNITIENEKITIFGHLKRVAHTCPKCNSTVREVKDTYNQLIKDVKAFDKDVFIEIKKHRYICRECGKCFLEENSFLKKYQRTTDRVLKKIFEMCSEVSSFTSIARELNIPVTTLIRKFDFIQYPKEDFRNVDVLAIDEFKGNTGGEKYNCVLADPKRKIILDILPKRYKKDLQEYFLNVKREVRQGVKIFISDMWHTYFDISKTLFNTSDFVVDKYHFIRQVIWAFENVRKEEQKKFTPSKRKYFKRSKSLLKKRFDYLSEDKKIEVNTMLYMSDKIRIAYQFKEDFLKILKINNPQLAKKELKKWIEFAKNCSIPNFRNVGITYENWLTGILNSFDTKYTNGYIEGCNNKIKVLKRNAYGYRNFERFRNRILHIFKYGKILKDEWSKKF